MTEKREEQEKAKEEVGIDALVADETGLSEDWINRNWNPDLLDLLSFYEEREGMQGDQPQRR